MLAINCYIFSVLYIDTITK